MDIIVYLAVECRQYWIMYLLLQLCSHSTCAKLSLLPADLIVWFKIQFISNSIIFGRMNWFFLSSLESSNCNVWRYYYGEKKKGFSSSFFITWWFEGKSHDIDEIDGTKKRRWTDRNKDSEFQLYTLKKILVKNVVFSISICQVYISYPVSSSTFFTSHIIVCLIRFIYSSWERRRRRKQLRNYNAHFSLTCTAFLIRNVRHTHKHTLSEQHYWKLTNRIKILTFISVLVNYGKVVHMLLNAWIYSDFGRFLFVGL